MSLQPDIADLLADRRWLQGLARGLVGDEHAVEDLLQETQLRVWRHPPADESRRGGWLRRIALNVSHRMRARDRARRLREDAVARPDLASATDELVARVEMQREVAEAVLRLDEPYRSVVMLRFFDDLPPRAIAARLEVPVETVRTRIRRALVLLRAQLDGRYGERGAWSTLLLPTLHGTKGVIAMSTGSKITVAILAVIVLGAMTLEVARLAREPADATLASATPISPVPAQSAPAPQMETAADARSARDVVDPNAAAHKVGARFTGIVLDAETRAPVRDARVQLHYVPGAERKDVEARSDSDGRFQVPVAGATGPAYWGEVSHVDYATSTIEHGAMPKDAPAELSDVNVPTVLLMHGTLVSGRVVLLPDRTPVASAKILVCPRAEYLPSATFGPDVAWQSAPSRADGTFQLDRRVVANEGSLAVLAVFDGRIGYAFLRPEHALEHLDDLEVAIEQPGSLAVHVVDDQNMPVPDVVLTACPKFPPFGGTDWNRQEREVPRIANEPWRTIFHAVTDADGRAFFPALPEGRVDPLLQPFGNPHTYVVHAIVAGWPDPREHVGIARGEETAVEIHLVRAVTHRIVGRIHDEQDHPIAGASIRVEGFADTHSTDDGTYATPTIDGPLGWVSLHVSAAGFSPDEFSATDSWTRSKLVLQHDDVAKPPCEVFTQDFTLRHGTNVRGRIVDEDGAPLAGVHVEAGGLNAARSNWVKLEAEGGKTDVEGRFVIEGVSVDYLGLEIEPPEEFLRPFPVRVVPGDQHMLVTVLREPKGEAHLVATIVDAATGTPLDPVSAYVRRVDVNQNRFPPARTAPGRVQADELAIGEWELVVDVNDGRRARARFAVSDAKQTIELRVEFAPPAIVEGSVFFGDEPANSVDRGCFVWVRASSNDSRDGGHAIDDDGRPISGVTDSCAQVDEHGRFRVGRLPAGMPVRFVVDGVGTSAVATVVLAPGETRKLEFHMQKPARVQWSQAEALPPGQLVIEVAQGDEPLSFLFAAPTGQAGTKLQQDGVGPGRLRWRARFTSSAEYPPKVRVANGEVDLAAGETRIVDVVGFR